jgi:hypothetical protein
VTWEQPEAAVGRLEGKRWESGKVEETKGGKRLEGERWESGKVGGRGGFSVVRWDFVCFVTLCSKNLAAVVGRSLGES